MPNVARISIEIDVASDGTSQLGQLGDVIDTMATQATADFSRLGDSIDAVDNDIDELGRSAQAAGGQLDSAASRAEQGNRRLASSYQSVNTGMRSTQQSGRGLSSLFNSLTEKVQELGPLLVSYFGAKGSGAVLGLANDFDILDARLGLVADSTQEMQGIQEALYLQSQQTGSSLAANTEFYASMGLALENVGVSSAELLQVSDLLTKSFSVSGSTSTEAAAAMLQFRQALSKGKLDGDEFKSMMEGNAVFAQEFAKVLGVTKGQMLEMSAAGELTVEKLLASFPQMADSINSKFEQMGLTVDKAKAQISNAFAKVISDANRASDGTGGIAIELSQLAGIVEQNGPTIEALFTGVVAGAKIGIRAVSGLTATVQSVAAAVNTMAGAVFYSLSGWEAMTDIIGLTDGATNDWKANAEAAFASADDLAHKANDSFQLAFNSAQEAAGGEGAYQEQVKKSSEVLKGKQAVQVEAAKISKQAQADALAAEEEYLSAAVADIEYLEQVVAEADLVVDSGVIISGAEGAAWTLEDITGQLDDLDGDTATISIEADTDSAGSSISNVNDQLAGMGGQLAVNTESVADLRAAIVELDNVPTLDPFGATRASYVEAIESVKAADAELRQERYDAEVDIAQKISDKRRDIADDIADVEAQRIDIAESIADKRLDIAKAYAEQELEVEKARAEQTLAVETDLLERQIALRQDRLSAEKDTLSAMEAIASATGTVDLDLYRHQSDAITKTAQEYQDLGIKQVKVEEFVAAKFKELRDEASAAGVVGLDSYQASLIKTAEKTGNFNDDLASTEDQIAALTGELEDLKAAGIDGFLDQSSAGFDDFSDTVEKAKSEIIDLQADLDNLQYDYSSGGDIRQLQQDLGDLRADWQKEDQESGRDVSSNTNLFSTSTRSSWLTGISSFDGGGDTFGWPETGGLDGKGGQLAVLHPKEIITDTTKAPAPQTARAGGGTVINNFFQQALGTSQIARIGNEQDRISRRS